MTVCVYGSTGQVTGLQRGPTTDRWEYDNQGRIISRVFADGKIWSYTYLDKVEAFFRHALLSINLMATEHNSSLDRLQPPHSPELD